MSLLAALALLVASPQSVEAPQPPISESRAAQKAYPEKHAYAADRDAHQDVDRALLDAKASGKIVVLIMGANWCHDSIGLAGWLDTPDFVAMMKDRYSLVFVDVGVPQLGHGRNLDIAKRFGIGKVKSTPLVLMLSPDGKRLNDKKDAISWRNAASRSREEIFEYFASFKKSK